MNTIEDLRMLRTSGRQAIVHGQPQTMTLRPYDEHRCIFVHVPRTGGLSVAKSLFGNLGGSHIPAPTYRAVFGEATFDSHFKFTFVRNPWDRLVSAYSYLLAGGGGTPHDLDMQRSVAPFDGFQDFVKSWLVETACREGVHLLTQTEFICLEDGTLGVDFVGRFETLAQDFEHVRDTLGIDADLAHLNASERSDYAAYYDAETRDIVADLYRKDIELLGYSFENSRPGA